MEPSTIKIDGYNLSNCQQQSTKLQQDRKPVFTKNMETDDGNNMTSSEEHENSPVLKKAKQKYQKLRAFLSKTITKKGEDDPKLISEQTRHNRAILGQDLPLGEYPMGYDSFPGPDITYTPPTPITEPMTSLGCLNSAIITDIVPIVKLWPESQSPYSFATGQNNNYQNTTTVGGVTNQLERGSSTPFHSSVYLTSDVTLYGLSGGAAATSYTPINLSQEGLLWTLWPLTKNKPCGHPTMTYFDDIYFGTAKHSRYPLGQMGYFINNTIIGCTPLGAANPNSGGPSMNVATFPTRRRGGQSSASNLVTDPAILPGVEGLNQALLTTTEQQVAIVVVKVTEQIARIDNPESGVASNQDLIYAGYDGWAVINMSTNPIGPMAMQTYITPQTVTGSVTEKNYQIILPPNFPTVMFYKNQKYNVPANTGVGLFMGAPF